MHPYTTGLKDLFEANADPVEAGPMSAYMRKQFPYLGIKSPKNGELQREYIATHGLPTVSDLDIITRELWALPEREFQYVAVSLISKLKKNLQPDFIETMETMIVTKSWWDTVDSLATDPVGTHFKRYPEVRDTTMPVWRKSNNLWLRRSCILFQLGYKHDTDFDLLKEIIGENLGSREFFINKAIGWALREYTRTDPDGVRAFVAETPLSSLSAREALKWLERSKTRQSSV